MYKTITRVALLGSCLLLSGVGASDRLQNLEQDMQQILIDNKVVFAEPELTDWNVNLEVLLWHIKSGGVDWALALNQGFVPQSGNMENLGFGWDWGACVGIAKTHLSDFELGLTYTYFKAQDSSKVAANFAGAVGSGVTGNASIEYSGKVSYNALDLTLGSSLFTSGDVLSSPHLGLKNIWIHEHFHLDNKNFVNDSSVQGDVNLDVVDDNKVWAIGPAMGWDLEWYVFKCFSLLASFDAALLQGYFKVYETQLLQSIPSGDIPLTESFYLTGNEHQFIPYGRVLLGVNWGRDFQKGRRRVDVHLKYELNYFWRINQMLNQATGTTTGNSTRILITRWAEDLGLYGVSLGVTFGF